MTDAKQHYAVVGDPVGYSKSPLIFQHLFQSAGINAVYNRVSFSSVEHILTFLKHGAVSGINVTAPFKNEIANQVTLHGAAKTLGAVNTVVKKGDTLHGYNTDVAGVYQTLQQEHIVEQGKKVIVLGAGGAAQAAVYVLKQFGAEIIIVNRSDDRARKLAESFGCAYMPYAKRDILFEQTDMLVNCLPINVMTVSSEVLERMHTVFDANYINNPVSQVAQKKQCKVISGQTWLLQQALAAFELFVGHKAEQSVVAELKALLVQFEQAIPDSQTRHIVIAGFMGAGKTVVSRTLGEKLGLQVLDLDEVIEAQHNMSISQLFDQYGARWFRMQEQQALHNVLSQKRQSIIALGGGALELQQNRAMLTQNARVYWLWAPLNECLERCEFARRPLLRHTNQQEIAELYQKRYMNYAAAADIIVYNQKDAYDDTVYRLINEETNTCHH